MILSKLFPEITALTTYRVISALGATALFTAGMANPSDSPLVVLFRYLCIGGMSSLFVLSFLSQGVRRHIGWGAYVVNSLLAAYLCTMLYTTRIDPESMIASFVGVLICGMVLDRIVLVITFLVTACILHIVTVFAVVEPIVGPMAFSINIILYSLFVGTMLVMQIASRGQRHQTESIMGAVFDQSSDALLYGDLENLQMLRANRQAERLFQTSDLNEMGRLTAESFVASHSEGNTYAALEAALADPDWEMNLAFNTAKGGRFYGALALRRLRFGDRRMLMARITDVTEHQKREAALNEAKEAAEAAAVARSQFLANMSHEIRTPMNGVIGMTSLLQRTQLDDDQSRYVEMVRSSGESLMTIIDEILDFSKLEASQVRLENERFDAEDVAVQALHLLSPLASSKGLELILRMRPGQHRFFSGDAQRLRQVLVNLLSNAVKFTSEGQVLLAVEAVPRTDTLTELHFSVEDSGIGIDPDRCAQLFEPFVQADASTTRRYGGTGLGLSISKNLVELMGGEIKVSSEPGEGSTFSFYAMVESVAERPPAQGQNLNSRRVYLAERNPLGLEVLGETLRAVGMVVHPFATARALLAAYQAGCCDLIIADAGDLQGDGLELVTELRRQDAALVPVVLLTPLESQDPGLADIATVVRKPIQTSHLIQTAEFVLEAQEPASQSRKHDAFNKPDFQHVKVLVAEDHPANQLVIRELLKKLGVTADIVDDGAEAVDAAARQAYDLIFMDIQMPRKDGLEAAREIRRHYQGRVPYVVAMTANALVSDRAACVEAGMNDFIAKPVRIDDLERRLCTVAAFSREDGNRRL